MLLMMTLQFAVICRTDDRRVWKMPDTATCGTLRHLRKALDSATEEPLPLSIKKMHQNARAKAKDENDRPGFHSNLMHHLGQLIEVEKGSHPTEFQGFPVYGLNAQDLEMIRSAIDSFSGNRGFTILLPTAMAYEGFIECRATNDVPRGKEQLIRFCRREFLDQKRKMDAFLADSGSISPQPESARDGGTPPNSGLIPEEGQQVDMGLDQRPGDDFGVERPSPSIPEEEQQVGLGQDQGPGDDFGVERPSPFVPEDEQHVDLGHGQGPGVDSEQDMSATPIATGLSLEAIESMEPLEHGIPCRRAPV